MSEQKICPYPGLRPFNEDESIFFRGREEHIEKIISQLEEKKFVMLTGASGDGKSSIVYAGVIPNARAGFFKAKFNSWQIADFRPERSPLKNMAIALADKLGYEDAAFVEKELGFGFSSLINLYKNSKYYLDQNSETWKNADDTEKKKLKRKAANLFILVDQFEEFFTNSENYHNGKASVPSQTVINLLLETAKIALTEDLPIYIICTMRSDYIGQCAAFRGLPEYIGFSQFFVPRLKRKEIHQVIEEPATLSGNTISNRLTETLINELGDGFDQLPVLQHALNQVWNQADKGNEEMDLIHLAKLSGLPEKNLPVDDRQNFKEWFITVPEFKKEFFKNPSLENVLNSHANELYNTAFEYYNVHHDDKITKEDACAIIKSAFQCLTKIDDSRAVRNRMTLEEITHIINRPEITTEIVGGVLDVFRLQGNTFLKPFITADSGTAILKPTDVIDITHESLIRNWDLLTEWAKEEYENWVNFLDFNKQLQRWTNNGKAKGYLLPIGPLTFFEAWYNGCKPNKYWLARYDESEFSKEEKLAKAEITLQNAQLFIQKSSDKLFFSRFVLKHGARKLSIGLIYIIFLPVCVHYYFDYARKQNNQVVYELEQRCVDLLGSVKVSNSNKAQFLINYERLEPGSAIEALNGIENDTLAFDLAKEMFGSVQNFETINRTKAAINPLVYPLLTYMDERIDNLVNRQRLNFKTVHAYDLSRINAFLSVCAFVKSYDDNAVVKKVIDKNVWVLNVQLKDLLEKPIDSASVNITQFNNSIQLLLALAPKIDFKYFIKKLSLWENEDEPKQRFDKFYGQDETYGYIGYHILACLYAADTDPNEENFDKITSCLDMEMSNVNYGKIDYFTFFDIINTLTKYNNYSGEKISLLLNEFSKSSLTDLIKVMDKTIADNFNDHIPYERLTDRFSQFNYFVKYFRSSEQRDKVWGNYISMLENIRKQGKFNRYQLLNKEDGSTLSNRMELSFGEEDFNFYSAIYYKKRGTYCAEVLNDLELSDINFKKAFGYYNLLSEEYKNSVCEIGTSSKDPKIFKKSVVFFYPKLLNESSKTTYYGTSVGWYWSPYGIMPEQSKSTAFYDYYRRDGSTKEYEGKDGMKMLGDLSYSVFDNNFENDTLFYSIVFDIGMLVVKDTSNKKYVNSDFVSLAMVNYYFEKNDTTRAFDLYSKFDIKKIIASGFLKDTYDEFNTSGTHVFLLSSLAKHFAVNNRLEESFKIINVLKGPVKRNLIIDIAYELQEKGPVENSFIYLDSLFKNNDVDGKPKFGNKLICVLGMIGSKEMYDLSMKLIKDIPEMVKPNAIANFIEGVAYNKDLYFKAMEYIPASVSSNKEFQLYNEILITEVKKRLKQTKQNGWKNFDEYKGDNAGDYENVYGDLKFDSLD